VARAAKNGASGKLAGARQAASGKLGPRLRRAACVTRKGATRRGDMWQSVCAADLALGLGAQGAKGRARQFVSSIVWALLRRREWEG